MGKRGGNETVLSDSRLAITLRMLAGARYGDLMLLYCIKQCTVYNVFHDTVDALNEVLKFPLLPKTDEGLRRLANEMKLSRCRGNPLTGCIGALDGICIKIDKPRAELNPALFYCRKGYYAIPVQALVDHSYRFLCASANCVGSTHDSLSHSSSKLGIYLMRGLLGKAYWIAGEEAYICTECLLTPYPASQLPGFIFRQSFNFFLSSMRMHVEQAFGMLKAKWLILDHLKFNTEKCSSLILLTMKLHNYCMDLSTGQQHNRSQREISRMHQESQDWYELAKRDDFDRVDSLGRCSTFGESEEANFSDAACTKREHFVAHLQILGISRPGRIIL